jgi:hypothetical protein
MSVPVLYLGWRDLGKRRKGRVWKIHLTPDPRELSVPPFQVIARMR